MPIFIEQEGRYKKLKVEALTKERTLQLIVEQNLFEILEMHFLATEYATTFGGRIDTLAVDLMGAPVIIEYKLNSNENIINQGLSYLRWLKAQKVEFFEMLVIRTLGKEVSDKIKIDWDNPRVICIAESYSKFDLDTVEVLPMRLELFKYRLYERGIFSLEPLNTTTKTQEKIKQPKLNLEAVTTENKFTDKANSTVKELFEELRSRIMQLDEGIVEKINPRYITFKMSKSFADVHFRKTSLHINLRNLKYDDPRHLIKSVPETYQWTLGRILSISNSEEMDYGMKFIEQSYKDVL
jgi:predicted transport protein